MSLACPNDNRVEPGDMQHCDASMGNHAAETCDEGLDRDCSCRHSTVQVHQIQTIEGRKAVPCSMLSLVAYSSQPVRDQMNTSSYALARIILRRYCHNNHLIALFCVTHTLERGLMQCKALPAGTPECREASAFCYGTVMNGRVFCC